MVALQHSYPDICEDSIINIGGFIGNLILEGVPGKEEADNRLIVPAHDVDGNFGQCPINGYVVKKTAVMSGFII